LFLIITYIGAFGSINNSYFQGIRNFKWLGFISIFSVSIRVLLAPLFIYLGMGINGALTGIFLAVLLPTVIAYINIYAENKHADKNISTSFKESKKYVADSSAPILPIFLAAIAFSLMTQVDVILVNRFFPAFDAGMYSAAATIGRAVLYLPGGVAIVIFPYVASLHAQGESDYRDFYRLFLLTFFFCALAALFLFIFSDSVIEIFYGEAYVAAGNILKWYGLCILPLAMVMIAENFLIAKGELIFTWVFMFFAPLQVLFIYSYHQNILTVLQVMFISGLALLIVGVGIIFIKGKLLQLKNI
jgi:O-antigen/teichoic acid export membrane protein